MSSFQLSTTDNPTGMFDKTVFCSFLLHHQGAVWAVVRGREGPRSTHVEFGELDVVTVAVLPI